MNPAYGTSSASASVVCAIVSKAAMYDKFSFGYPPGPGCSKLTSSLVNMSLNFQKLISEICQYFFMKKC